MSANKLGFKPAENSFKSMLILNVLLLGLIKFPVLSMVVVYSLFKDGKYTTALLPPFILST